MNIPRYELDGWEADDLLGTIAARDTAAGWETVIVTGDKDSLQLVSDHATVKLVTTRMGQTTTRNMTPAVFREEYGFDPIHIVDLKALMGDSSDNIPGVKGIGEKTAMDLIQRYGSVEAIYQGLDTLEAKPAVLKKLREGEEGARLSYDLATIRCEAPIPFAPEDNLRPPSTTSSSSWSSRSSSTSWASKLPRGRPSRRSSLPAPAPARWWRTGPGPRSCWRSGAGRRA